MLNDSEKWQFGLETFLNEKTAWVVPKFSSGTHFQCACEASGDPKSVVSFPCQGRTYRFRCMDITFLWGHAMTSNIMRNLFLFVRSVFLFVLRVGGQGWIGGSGVLWGSEGLFLPKNEAFRIKTRIRFLCKSLSWLLCLLLIDLPTEWFLLKSFRLDIWSDRGSRSVRLLGIVPW